MAGFAEQHLEIDGVDTAVFTAGDGDSLVFFHGAGTVTGFDALLPLADRFRLIVPHHPGYGASADDPSIDGIYDYVRHYLNLLDELDVGEISLAGHSMGGYLAALFASLQRHRVYRLVLVEPIGLRVREHPTVDIFSVPDEELLGRLTGDMSVFEGKVPMPPTPDFLAERYRESTSTARVFWSRVYDLKLPKWLSRLTMPTLLLWGDHDQLVPVEQASVWAELIPDARVKILPGIGHLPFDETPAAAEAVAEFLTEARM